MISYKNFSTFDVASIPVAAEYQNCNFTRSQPVDSGGGVFVGERLFPGDDTPRTFRDCNLVNCELPPGSTVINCNTTILQRGLVHDTEEIVVDGVVVSSRSILKDVLHGRYVPETETYLYFSPPTDVILRARL